MSEITDVLGAITALHARGADGARDDRQCPRLDLPRPGARLPVPENGALIGNVSGGCWRATWSASGGR